MYKNTIKFGLIIFSLLMLCIVQASKSHAQLAINDNSTYGDQNHQFTLDFYDDINNVEKFKISGDKKISDSSYYNPPGKKLDFDFYSYDPETDQVFSLSTGSTATTYGYDYIPNGKIRISKGEIRLAENDVASGIWLRGSDDEFSLNLSYNGSENIMIMKPDSKGKYGLKEGTNDLHFKPELILRILSADLEIIVPLKKKSKNLTTGEINGKTVIIDDKSPNYGRPVLTETTAKIQIRKARHNGELKNFIFFDNGLYAGMNDGLQITDYTKTDTTTSIKKTPFGFGTQKFKLPEKGSYKGLSTEQNIEDALVGIINFVLGFVASIAVLVLIYGGYLWIIDRGEGTYAEKSRKLIANAVIGILLIISAWTIINTITSISDVYPEGCEVGFDMGGGETDFDIDCNISSSNSLLGGGIQGAVDLIF